MSCNVGLILILILTFTIGMFLMLQYYKESNVPYTMIITAEEASRHVKSGDIVLFHAGDASKIRRALMFGRYTHVAVIYRDGERVFILDAGEWPQMNLFLPLVQRYESSETHGQVVIRTLSPPLSAVQEARFARYITGMKDLAKMENGGNGLTVNEATGEWHGTSPWNIKRMMRTLNNELPLCTGNHVLHQNIPFDHYHGHFCTDGLMTLMRDLGWVDTTNVPSCLLPNYFSSTEVDTLNQCMRASFKYAPEIQLTFNN